MGNHNDPIREGIENFVGPVTQMFRNIGNIGTNISDAISDLGDAVSKSKNESANGSDNVEKKGGCLKPILYLIAITLLFSMCGTEEEYDPASDIAMVQSGYLGEYTDVPVQELLWFLYSNVSDSQEWEGFICDDGYPIVQVTYSRNDAPDSPAIFQFSIADQQFVLSGYRDPLAEVEEITDLYSLLNYTYLEWRSQNYSGDFPYDPSLIDELNDISGSSIMYGASKSYTGDRSTLNQDYGEELLPLSVPWLLDNYGYIDMAMYPEVPYNEQAFGGNIETSQGKVKNLGVLGKGHIAFHAKAQDIGGGILLTKRIQFGTQLLYSGLGRGSPLAQHISLCLCRRQSFFELCHFFVQPTIITGSVKKQSKYWRIISRYIRICLEKMPH